MNPELNIPPPDEPESEEVREAYRAGVEFARANWQPDARTAVTALEETATAHQNQSGEWEMLLWSATARRGLRVFLDRELKVSRHEEWGAFYEATARQVGDEILGHHGFSYAREVSFAGPDNLSFVFRRQSPTYAEQYDFVDIQISSSIMLTPPPRRFTVNLLRNKGERPAFGGEFGGYEQRLAAVIPDMQPDYWWSFKTEEDYAQKLREALQAVVQHGLASLM